MNDARTIAVVGAGPAGATLARLLAPGRDVVLLGGRANREKPCGGGVTARGWRGREPFDRPIPHVQVREAVVEAGARRAAAPLAEPVRIYRRRDLDQALLDAAIEAGARLLEAKARSIEPEGEAFRIDIEGGPPIRAAFVAGADGAVGISRKALGAGRCRHALARGFHVPRQSGDEVLLIRFPEGVPGYVWSFPRVDAASAGICSREPRAPADLDAILRRSLEESGRCAEPIPGTAFSHPIPDFASFEGPRAGPGWALIGDAAAFVDPITLEGIAYAIRSAEVLAEAILAGTPERYEEAWRADFGRELVRAARFAREFYGERFPARMVRCAEAHPRVRRIVGEMMDGTGSYRWLRLRTAGAALTDRLRPFRADS
jgi:flavin-dependent dehydrogenase